MFKKKSKICRKKAVFKTFSHDDSNVTVHVQITRQLFGNHMTVTLSDFWLTSLGFEKHTRKCQNHKRKSKSERKFQNHNEKLKITQKNPKTHNEFWNHNINFKITNSHLKIMWKIQGKWTHIVRSCNNFNYSIVTLITQYRYTHNTCRYSQSKDLTTFQFENFHHSSM